MIRVLLVVPSPALRAGLRAMLSGDPDLRVVADCARWDEVQEISSEADVAITTSASFIVSGDEEEGIAQSLPVLFLTDEASAVRRIASRLAIWGVLPEEASSEELGAALRALAQGLVVGAPQLLFGEDTSSGGSPLTDREAEVLGWLAKGLANKQIAAELGISEHTVKFHVSSIYGKLNATNRTQAVREGLRNGWIPL